MAGDVGRSAVLRALPVFRELILAAEDGAFLGSEAELLELIGVSAPTLRQVARLLEHEELLVIKRGVRGGFFARRPSAETVARSAALFLSVQNTSLEEVYSASQTVNDDLMRRAALSADEAGRAVLAEIVAQMRDGDRPPERDEFIALAKRMNDQIAVIAGNAPLALFLRVFRHISLNREPGATHFPEVSETWRDSYARLGEAILAHDPEAATACARRLSELARDSVPSAAG